MISPKHQLVALVRPPAAELVQRVADFLQISPATLLAPCKERNVVRAKAVICHVAVRRLGIKGVDIAATLGYSSTAVTHVAKRGEAILAADRDLERKLGGIAKL